jgi:hypothetical protein
VARGAQRLVRGSHVRRVLNCEFGQPGRFGRVFNTQIKFGDGKQSHRDQLRHALDLMGGLEGGPTLTANE